MISIAAVQSKQQRQTEKKSFHAIPQSRSRRFSIYRESKVRLYSTQLRIQDAIEALSRAMIPNKRHRGITGGEKNCRVFISGAPSDKFSSEWRMVGFGSSLQASLGPIFSALRNGPLIYHGMGFFSADLSVPGLYD